MKLKWSVNTDGSFDLVGDIVSLSRSYPAIDGVAIRPTRLEVESQPGGPHRVRYFAVDYTLELILSELPNDDAALDAQYLGLLAPRRIDVIGLSTITGAKRVFKQAHGIMGGCGFIDIHSSTPTISHAMMGLVASSDHAGSSLVLAVYDHRRFEQSYTVSKGPFDDSPPVLSAGFGTQRIPLPEGRLQLPRLHVSSAPVLFDGLRHAARGIAKEMSARDLLPTSYHWCSWYYLYYNLDMPLLREYLQGFNSLKPACPLHYVQIDAGYFPSAGDWLLPNHRFPNGLTEAFTAIKQGGYKPGIWIGPFMVGNRSKLAKEHPDWLLRNNNGELLKEFVVYGEGKVWGLPDEETYILDTSHPAAFAYLRHVFRELCRQGAEMFKTDFMYWGLHDSTKVRRHTPGKTGVEYLRDVATMIREEIGQETFWLGCIAPYMPFVGFVDSMRIAGDVVPHWRSNSGPDGMISESANSQHFNNLFWQNDPDSLFVRDFHIELTSEEVKSLAYWQAFLGGSVNTSDPIHLVSPERLSLWRKLQPAPGRNTAAVPLFGRKTPLLAAVREHSPGLHAVLLLNPTEAVLKDRVSLPELGLAEHANAFEVLNDRLRELGDTKELDYSLPPHASVLFYVGGRELPDSPPDARLFGGT